MLFHLFCMFHDYLEIEHRSQNSAGKSTARMRYFGRSIVEGSFTETPIFPDDGGSQKGEPAGPKVDPDHRAARPMAWPCHLVVRGPHSPFRLLFFAKSFVPKT